MGTAAAAFAALLAAPLKVQAQLPSSASDLPRAARSGRGGDVSDLLGLAGRGDQGVAARKTDVDRRLDKSSRRKRMTACLTATRTRMTAKPDEVDTAVGSLMAQREAAGAAGADGLPDMTEEQAVNQLLFSMVMSCYAGIDNSSVSKVIDGGRLPPDAEEALFRQSSSPPRPTPQQFKLLESVIEEEQAKLMKEMRPEDMPGAPGIIGRSMSTRAKVAYVLVVIAGVFGGGLWALKRMMRGRPPKQRSAKAMRKFAKAMDQLEKKRR